MIFNDPSHKEYDFWDLRLLKAYYFTEDFTRDGIPVWWDESERVTFDVKKKVSRSKAAIDRAQTADSKGNKTPVPGRYYTAEPRSNDGGELPTFQEWMEERARLNGRKGLVQ